MRKIGLFASFIVLLSMFFSPLEVFAVVDMATPLTDTALVTAYQKALPSTVAIYYEDDGVITEDRTISAGSGFFVAPHLIMTSRHVVNNGLVDQTQFTPGVSLAKPKYFILTSDKKILEPKAIYLDPFYDIALIEVAPQLYPVVTFGNSKTVLIGQQIFSIGNLEGTFDFSLVTGTLSNKNQKLTAGSGTQSYMYENGLVLNMSTIPGNSGGPLLDMNGNVIGVVSARYANSETLGFAVTSDIAEGVYNKFKTDKNLVYPFLGVVYKTINWRIKLSYNLPFNSGAYIYSANNDAIIPDSPAAKAGLKNGDVITKVNDIILDESMTLKRALSRFRPGDSVKLEVVRDQLSRTISVTLDNAANMKNK